MLMASDREIPMMSSFSSATMGSASLLTAFTEMTQSCRLTAYSIEGLTSKLTVAQVSTDDHTYPRVAKQSRKTAATAADHLTIREEGLGFARSTNVSPTSHFLRMVFMSPASVKTTASCSRTAKTTAFMTITTIPF